MILSGGAIYCLETEAAFSIKLAKVTSFCESPPTS